ncbi:MAG: M1 family metallopeptidase [Saprospiraceae bacterium]
MKFIYFIFISIYSNIIFSQNCDYWQQKVDYKITCEVDKNKIEGQEKIVYYNNSPDTLHKIYFHLYYNAFQKESMMSKRAQTIVDPERNMDKKFEALKEKDSGKVEISSLKQDNNNLDFEIIETILKAKLDSPLAPGDSTVFDLSFKTQIPELIRRAGMDSNEGIKYNMAQWYPKIVEYDYQGYHPDFYIGREFYGVWGNYDVTINIDSKYTVAAGCDYFEKSTIGDKTKWHFTSKNVHDFVWAADEDYVHYSIQADSLTTFHFYYQNEGIRKESWPKLGNIMKDAFKFMNSRYGRYQYPTYSFIEAGDGGMEYPLATFITGKRSINSLTGISIHEFLHSWYQMQLATNESLYPWMDEGFTSFATIEVMEYLINRGELDREFPDFPFENDYNNFMKFQDSNISEPMSTHSDRYDTNLAYSLNAYNGGLVFLEQLEYIIGKQDFDKGLLDYFNKWKFKHPTPNDFIRVMEKNSDLELHWYLQYFIDGLYFIDYSIANVEPKNKNTTKITLENNGDFPMPIDVLVTLKDGTIKYFNIPLTMMLGHKKQDAYNFTVLPSWDWVDKNYEFELEIKYSDIQNIDINPSHRLADIESNNNKWINQN